MSPPAADDQPTTCVLAHKGFALLGAPLFRRAETDNAPVMAVTLGERQVALPLRSLQREFSIEDDTPDGRMLVLIAEALDFVTVLRIGDALPREICTGEASWEPEVAHQTLASARLRMQLVAWVNAGTGADQPEMSADALLRVADDPLIRRQVQDALDHAAMALGLASQDAVVELLEDLARELAFIESLRERLLRRVQAMALKIERMVQAWRGDSSQTESLTQVRRLTGIALKEIAQRFAQLDAQTSEVMSTLRNASSQRAFIRDGRDWLYRSLRAWKPILDDWDEAETEFGDGSRGLLARTYRFLAPRYMPVTEWLTPSQLDRKKPVVRQMAW